MKRKFSHEEVLVTSILVAMCASMMYVFGLLIYNVVISGCSMNI